MAKVSARVHRAVWLRQAGGRTHAKCQFPSCRSRWCYKPKHHSYHIAHNDARSRGGSNDIDNLLLLCKKHNQLMGKRTWPQYLQESGLSARGAGQADPHCTPTVRGRVLKQVAGRFLKQMCVLVFVPRPAPCCLRVDPSTLRHPETPPKLLLFSSAKEGNMQLHVLLVTLP